MYRNQNVPQNAIQQSSDFIDLGKRESALEILYEAVRVRRGKTWSPSIEEAMGNFLSLSLSLLNVQGFRDGSNQYRILCQMTNVTSFDKVMTKFFDDCLVSAQKARGDSREKLLADDLDCLETAETVLLKSVSETTHQERADRALLSPTLKFIWEAFKNTLENCKNNRNLEKVYADISKRAFKFLIKFERKTEFRKLCDLTRAHIVNITRYTQNTLSIVLSDPSSLEVQIEMRLAQLDTALSMELWNEAFKTMADIHYLLRHSKKAPHPKILAIFYQKISIVFARANAPLFHAIALQKLFILIKEHKKGFKIEELMRISSRVLAATLSIPLSSEQTELTSILTRFSDNYSNTQQLALILGLTSIPSRSSVVNDMLQISIIQYADPALVAIFEALDGKAFTHRLCSYVSSKLLDIPPILMDELSSYVEGIRKVAFSTLLKRISAFYKRIPLSRLVTYASYYDQSTMLNLILECRQTGIIDFVYDGETNVVHFSSGVSRMCESFGVVNHNILKGLFDEVSPSFFELSSASTTQSISELIGAYRENPLSEQERYRGLRDEAERYMEEVSREREEIDRQHSARMEEERLRLDKLQLMRMEEERKRRDEKRTLEQNIAIRGNENGHALYSHNNIPVQNEQQEREVAAHAKKLKKIEKTVDAFVLTMRHVEVDRLPVYLAEASETKLERWRQRDEERQTTLNRLRKSETEIRTRFLTADDDVKVFVKIAADRAKQAHQQLLEEYHELLQKERHAVLAKMRINHIQKRKEQHVAALKVEFLKKHNMANNVSPVVIPTGSKFVIGNRRASKVATENPEPASQKTIYTPGQKNKNYGFK